jgi:excisionase family DNA binding protein
MNEKLDAIQEHLLSGKHLPKPLDANQAAEYLSISISSLYKLTSSRGIKYYKTGKRLYFKQKDLDNYLFKIEMMTQEEIEEKADEYLRKNRHRL